MFALMYINLLTGLQTATKMVANATKKNLVTVAVLSDVIMLDCTQRTVQGMMSVPL